MAGLAAVAALLGHLAEMFLVREVEAGRRLVAARTAANSGCFLNEPNV